MNPLLYVTQAQIEYCGPQEIRIFADILPFIGEAVISFSWLERRITWGIESMLGTTIDEADRMEDFVQNFSARIKFFELIGTPIARSTNTVEQLNKIVTDTKRSNSIRNKIIHNSFSGIQIDRNEKREATVSALKKRFNEKAEKRSYTLSKEDLRCYTEENFKLCTSIQTWILTVKPNAENRMP